MLKIYEITSIDFHNSIHKRRYAVKVESLEISGEKEAIEKWQEARAREESLLDCDLYSCSNCVDSNNKSCLTCDMYCIHGYGIKQHRNDKPKNEKKTQYYKNKQVELSRKHNVDGMYKNYPTGFPFDME